MLTTERIEEKWLRYDELASGGLDGGTNVYAYVGNNPLRFTDPTGEVAVVIPLAGALGQAIVDGATAYIGAKVIGDAIGKALDPSNIVRPMEANFPPGYWAGDKGAEEWGRRDGCGAKEGKRRFHKGVKQDDNMSKPRDKYGVNPSTGDVIDPAGDVIGNLGNE